MTDWIDYGPLILSQHPIRLVNIEDKRPEWPAFPGNFWRKWPNSFGGCFHIPDVLFPESHDSLTIEFTHWSAGYTWLSDRCIAWAKSQAASLASA